MTKFIAIVLSLICIYFIRAGIQSWDLSKPRDFISAVRYIAAAVFLMFFVVALFKTDKTLLEFFSFLWK